MGDTLAAPYMAAFRSFGGSLNDTYGNYSTGSIKVHDGSSAIIQKSLVICNGGYSPVDVRRNSSLLVGDSRVGSSVTPGYADLYYGVSDRGNSEITPVYGNLSITGFNGKAIRISENSSATVGSLFAKHPLHADGSVGVTGGLPSSATPVVLVDTLSSASFGRVYAVTHPAGKLVSDSTITPLWNTITGTKYGSHYQASTPESMMRADSGSSIFVSNAGSMFAFDGGTANMQTTNAGLLQQYAVFGSNQRSTIVSEGSDAVVSYTTNTQSNTRTISDTRGVAAPFSPQKIMTRSAPTTNTQYLYGASTNRTWSGTGAATSEHNYIANPTNIGALGVAPGSGNTYSAILGKGGSITN
jgi:hypothetical protein